MKNVFVIAAMTVALTACTKVSANEAEQFGKSGQLIFGGTIPAICGLQVTKERGDIDFEDRDDERDEEEAVFIVRNNHRGTRSHITLATSSVTEGMVEADVSYEWEVNGSDDTDYEGVFQVEHKDKVSVEANYHGDLSDVAAGYAEILTEVTIECAK